MDEPPPERPPGSPRSPFETDPNTLVRTVGLVRRIVSARGYRIPREDRAEILQETMLQLWRALTGSSADPVASVDGLAATIAHRRCLAWMRRRRWLGEIPPDLSDPAPSAEDDVLRQERRALGLRVIRSMPEGCREILRMHMFQKLTYREIATRLNRSEHGLRTQVCECLREARAMMERIRRRDETGTRDSDAG